MTATHLDVGGDSVLQVPGPALEAGTGGTSVPARFRRRAFSVAFAAVATLSLLVLVLYPLITILIQSVFPDVFSVPASLAPSLGSFSRVFSTPEVYGSMLNTAWLGVAVAVLGTLVGAVVAVLVRNTDLPGRRVFDGLVWITLFTPSYLVALAWELLFSRGGFIDSTIAPLPDAVVNTIFSPVGLAAILTLRLFPFSYLAVSAALRGLGSEYEDAARMVGASPLRCWLRINGPLLAPALFAGGLIIFAEAISDYGTAATIAQQAGFNLVTYELYAAMNNAPVDFALTAALALILIVAIAVALMFQARLLRARSYQVITGRTRPARRLPLRAWRLPLTLLMSLFFVAALLLPLAATLAMSFMRNLGDGLVASNFTLANYQAALDAGGEALPAIERSAALAVGAATLAALLGAAVAFVVERTRVPGRAFLRLLTVVTLAIPGIVLAVGYIFAWNQPWMQNVFGFTPYGTIGLLLVAYVAEALPFSARLAGGALAQVGDHLLEAGRMAGATTAQLFRHIVLPVVATALLSTWMLNFTGVLFELPASELLQPAGEPPLSVQIINQYSHYRQGPGTAMTIVAIAIVAVAALLIAGAARAVRARGGKTHARRGF